MTRENMTCWVAGEGESLRIGWQRTQQRKGCQPIPNATAETVERCLSKLTHLGFRTVTAGSEVSA